MKTLFESLSGAALALGALILLAFLLLAASARGQSTDGYSSLNDVTTSTNNNTVMFVGVPTKAIRLLSVTANSDTNTAILSLIAGTTPTTVTNVINGTNLNVSTTAGIISNQLAILQRGVTQAWLVTVLVTNGNTNATLALGGSLGFTPAIGDVLWTVTNRIDNNIPVGRTTITGEAIHAAQLRAPLAVRLSPSGWVSNRVHATVKYDQL